MPIQQDEVAGEMVRILRQKLKSANKKIEKLEAENKRIKKGRYMRPFHSPQLIY